MTRKDVLLLNADYSPLQLMKYQKAINLDWKDKAFVVELYDEYLMLTHDRQYPLPAVLALKEYESPLGGKNAGFSRGNVFFRDKLTCQYCGEQKKHWELTYDHVYPRSRWDYDRHGTSTRWTNIVTACKVCNLKKSNQTLEQSGMTLTRHPVAPSAAKFVKGLRPWTTIQPEWIIYLPQWLKELVLDDY